jgi:hypothetical protein
VLRPGRFELFLRLRDLAVLPLVWPGRLDWHNSSPAVGLHKLMETVGFDAATHPTVPSSRREGCAAVCRGCASSARHRRAFPSHSLSSGPRAPDELARGELVGSVEPSRRACTRTRRRHHPALRCPLSCLSLRVVPGSTPACGVTGRLTAIC